MVPCTGIALDEADDIHYDSVDVKDLERRSERVMIHFSDLFAPKNTHRKDLFEQLVAHTRLARR